MKRCNFLFWVIIMGAMCAFSVHIQGNVSSFMKIRCSHLKEYNYFKEYNQNHFFNQFVLSEVWSNGEPYYRLLAPAENIEVRINRKQTEASVSYLGKSMNFHIGGFLNTKANLYLSDLTDDDIPELIYQEPSSGVEGSIGNCEVIDIHKMNPIKIQKNTKSLLKKIQIEEVGIQKDNIICKVVDQEHHIYFGQVNANSQDKVVPFLSQENRTTIEYDMTAKRLKTYACFVVPGYKERHVLGDICGYFKYNVVTEQFELGDEYTITLWNPLHT